MIVSAKLQAISTPETLLPTTRYVGSKRKLIDWIWQRIGNLSFDTCLEPFAGTGIFSYYMKRKMKEVFYNDLLRFNYFTGLALIENSGIVLSDDEIKSIINPAQQLEYPTFIERTFDGMYYTRRENHWLDIAITNINSIKNKYKRAVAFHALFQACIIKRPYNLFHRANLYMRMAKVDRSFGNLVSWNTQFEVLFKRFVTETNDCVFANQRKNLALNMDVMDLPEDRELVYVDSPYMTPKSGGIDYRRYYHFLEGISQYSDWHRLIDYKASLRNLKSEYSIWLDEPRIVQAFEDLFDKFRRSTLVVSYRSGGIPSSIVLKRLLSKYKKEVCMFKKHYQYALADTSGWELLFVGK